MSNGEGRGNATTSLKFLNQNWCQFRLYYVRRPIDTAELTMYTYSPGLRTRHEIRDILAVVTDVCTQ